MGFLTQLRSDFSKLLLIACDQSYQSDIESNALLSYFPDSPKPGTPDIPSEGMPEDWNNLNLNRWTVVKRYDEPNTGFGATLYRAENEDGSSDYIVAMQGTRGPNIQDWSGNLIYGWDKWGGESAEKAQELMSDLLALDKPKKINFTGQSLGGALAQYALYDYATRKVGFESSKVTLTTFNGLGGIEVLTQHEPGFQASLVEGVDTAHFYIKGDLVSRLGGGNLNGTGNEYILNFRKAADDGIPWLRADSTAILLDFVSAHRIESGFYRGFNLAHAAPSNEFPLDFTQAKQLAIARLDIAGLAKTGTFVAWLTNQDGALATDTEAYARAIAALIVSMGVGDPRGFEALVTAVADNFYGANYINGYGRNLIVQYAPHFLEVLAVSPTALQVEITAQFVALMAEANGSTNKVELPTGLADRLSELITGASITPGSLIFDPSEVGTIVDATLSRLNGLNKAGAIYAGLSALSAVSILSTLPLVIPTISAAATVSVALNILRIATDDVPAIAKYILRETAQLLKQEIGKASDASAKIIADMAKALIEIAIDVSRGATGIVIDGKTFVDGAKKAISEGLLEVAKSISNAYQDLVAKFSDVFELGSSLDRNALRTIIDSFSDLERSATGSVRNALSETVDVLMKSGETISLQRSAGVNPFGIAGFNPDLPEADEAVVKEGGGRSYSLYLPYEADEGGQKISLEFAGDSAGVVRVITQDGTLDPIEGRLTISLRPGQRQASFSVITGGDFDIDETIQIFATLVDDNGTATHQTHLEATLVLDATLEISGLPEAARVIFGDLQPINFGNDPDQIQTHPDDLGNVQTTGASEVNRDDTLFDSTGSDHIVAGGGKDLILATRGGDDFIEAGDGSDGVDAGIGNDLVLGGFGRDILAGGEGEDRLFAESEVSTEEAIDLGITAPNSGEPGDWLSGNEGADLLVGANDEDIFEGGDGDDLIVAGGGDDVIEADGDIRGFVPGEVSSVSSLHEADPDGSTAGTVEVIGPAHRFVVSAPGDDVVHAGAGDDWVFGGGGDDFVSGDAGVDIIFGDSGDDTLLGGDGNDVISGDNGGSVLVYSEHGDDFVDGGSGDDEIYGNGGSDVLFGGEGNDQVVGDSSIDHAGDDYIDGEGGDDLLVGGRGADTIYGGGGIDSIVGDVIGANGAGEADFLDGEAGNDTILGQGGDDTLHGGDGIDFLEGDAGNDTLEGGDGDDNLLGDDPNIAGAGGNDFLDGGKGDDQVFGMAGDDTLIGGEGNDILEGDDPNAPDVAGNDVLIGDEGDDQLIGMAGNDLLDGGDGEDLLDGGIGNDTLSGGAGNDTMAGRGGSDTLDGGTGDDLMVGEDGDDTLSGGSGDDQMSGGVGNDKLDGGDGNDTIIAGEGNDTLDGGIGDDELVAGTGFDHLDGGEGNDFYFLEAGVTDSVMTIADSGGDDTLVLSGVFFDGVRLGLGSLALYRSGETEAFVHIEGFDPVDPTGSAVIDHFIFDDGEYSYAQLLGKGFDLTGTPESDDIVGTEKDDRIDGLASDDTLEGLSGNDSIFGREGSDLIFGDEGDDLLDGGADADSIHGGIGNDILLGGGGDDQIFGNDGNDTLNGGTGADTLAGGSGNDLFVGDSNLDQIVEGANEGIDTVQAGVNFLLSNNVENLLLTGSANLAGTGNELRNTIVGNAGDNVLLGLNGDDALVGNDGNDILDGGVGSDSMRGGLGNDTYIVDVASDAVVEEPDEIERGEFTDPVNGGLRFGRISVSGGIDTVRSDESYTLTTGVENLVLTGSSAIDGVGTVEANHIEGNDRDNSLYAYRLNGETEDYSYLSGVFLSQFTDATDFTEEILFDRANIALWRGDYRPATQLRVALTPGDGDSLLGRAGNDSLYGNLDNDLLIGGEGNDLLYGFAGADVMIGGTGDDIYVVTRPFDLARTYAGGHEVSYHDEGGDTLFENAGEGLDTVVSEVDFTLPANFENLTIVEFASNYDSVEGMSILNQNFASPHLGIGNTLDNVLRTEASNVELRGLDGEDTLYGSIGSDRLDGGTGSDRMEGGQGSDVYVVGQSGDSVIERPSEMVWREDTQLYEFYFGGIDLVESSIDYELSADVENLTLTGSTAFRGTGNSLDNIVLGNGGDNVLSGGAGNDILDGGAGADLMLGGVGNDIYYFDNPGDVASEAGGGAFEYDIVYSSITHTLGAGFEELHLLGDQVIDGTANPGYNAIYGNDATNRLDGHRGAGSLFGLGGDDFLLGGIGNDVLDGGAGGDLMVGGEGADVYYVDSFGDVIIEDGVDGYDYVISTVSHALSDNVEELDLSLAPVAQVLRPTGYVGVGNSLDNSIGGSDGADTLDGKQGDDFLYGSAGDDLLVGGDGDDYLDGGGDQIWDFELRESGDELPSGSEYATDLDEWGALEQLPEESHGEVSIHIGVLVSNADEIHGGSGNDYLDGRSGNDKLYGGDGNDTLHGGLDGPVVFDPSNASYGEGIVTNVQRFGDYFNDLPIIRTVTIVQLSSDDLLDGGAGNDLLEGESGNDLLFGGEGIDTLRGGSGNDVLDGGTGIDSMGGGVGDDVYFVDGTYTETTDILVYDDCGDLIADAVTRTWKVDNVFELGNQGYDVIYSAADFTLPFGFEELILQEGSEARLGLGRSDNDVIRGNSSGNRLEGGAGSDSLYGGAGNDVLDGGVGEDWLAGGAGDDIYNLYVGSGHDVIVSEEGGFDSIHVLDDLTVEDITLDRSGDDLVVALNGDDRMSLVGWFTSADRIRQIEFCDDSALDEAAIIERMTETNDAPVTYPDSVLISEDNVAILAGNVLANDVDADEGNVLALATTGILAGIYGTLTLSVDGSYIYDLNESAAVVQALRADQTVTETFIYAATDGRAVTPGSLTINIDGMNDAPHAYDDADVTREDGGPVTLDAAALLANDTDVDADDTRTIIAVTNSSAGARVSIAGSQVVYDVGSLFQSLSQGATTSDSFVYTMIDASGDASTATVVMTVTGLNDAPTANPEIAGVQEDNILAASGNILSNDVDIDLGTSFSVSPGTRSGTYGALTLAADGSFTYVLANGSAVVQALRGGQIAADVFDYAVSDGIAASASALTVRVTGTNDAPIVANPIADQQGSTGKLFSLAVRDNTITDIDAGDMLVYSATLANGNPLPSWLVFNPTTRTFTGIPSAENAGTWQIRLSAIDIAGASVFDVFALTIKAAAGKTIIGTDCDDTLIGTDFDDIIDGRQGADLMTGKLGDDKYYVDDSCDVVTELLGQGSDSIVSSVTYTLSANVENITLIGSRDINATGNALDNVLTGNSGKNVLNGGTGNDTLDGKGGADSMSGGTGNDLYFVDNSYDTISESTNQGNDSVQSTVTYTLGINVENLALIGSAGINGTGNTSANFLVGNSANNALSGKAGNDILQGLGGNDTLSASGGHTVFDGGTGSDTITGGSGNEMFIGGIGNDIITTGTGADIIAFNAGDGQDVVNASTGADNVLSLGGGIQYADLKMTKSGTNLILKIGGTDQITFKDWYSGNRSIAKLQIFTEAMSGYDQHSANILLNDKVEQFNFSALASAFDAAGQISGWALTNALLSTHLSGSDTVAIGGDLAYQYGKNGALSGIGLKPAQDILNASQFGSAAQTLRPIEDLQQGVIRLS